MMRMFLRNYNDNISDDDDNNDDDDGQIVWGRVRRRNWTAFKKVVTKTCSKPVDDNSCSALAELTDSASWLHLKLNGMSLRGTQTFIYDFAP
eukprot:scaffold180015_cov36-Prasinocladus_malaysianus.AAC.2